MELDLKHVNYPDYITLFCFFGLGALVFVILASLPAWLCQLFFWLPFVWVWFWFFFLVYMQYDKVEFQDDGFVISYSNMNWLTKRLRPLCIPWESLIHIQALYGKKNCWYYFVLRDGRRVRFPMSVEDGCYGTDVNDIAEAFGEYLRTRRGMDVPVHRVVHHCRRPETREARKVPQQYAEKEWKIIVSRLDCYGHVLSRKKEKHMELSYQEQVRKWQEEAKEETGS